MTVVIVDDHAGFRDQMRRLLEAAGYDVIGEAADGASGLTAALELRPGLVLLDVQLPDMSGFDVAERLAKQLADTAVVMISTRNASDYRERLASRPTLRFISKADLSVPALTAALGSNR